MQIDPASQINPFSRAVVHLTFEFNGAKLATGSGVLAKLPYSATGRSSEFQGYLFLVTALHNLTGREPNGQIKHRNGALPNFVFVEGIHMKRRFPLYGKENDPSKDIPLFWIHPKGPRIDVTLL